MIEMMSDFPPDRVIPLYWLRAFDACSPLVIERDETGKRAMRAVFGEGILSGPPMEVSA
jgi:hypothetical protein